MYYYYEEYIKSVIITSRKMNSVKRRIRAAKKTKIHAKMSRNVDTRFLTFT